MEIISIKTNRRIEAIEITHLIKEKIKENKIKDGIGIIYCPHTTAGVLINEHADPTVIEDILNKLSKLVPYNDNYKHLEGNSDAHIKSSLIGNSVNIIIEDSQIVLGTWQGIFFCEFDGPRNRKLYLKFIE